MKTLVFFLFLLPASHLTAAAAPADHLKDELNSVFLDTKKYIEEIAPSGSPLAIFFTDKSHKNRIQKLLDQFTKTPVERYEQLTHDERLAFWINLHNLYAVKLISDHFPVKSRRYYGRPLRRLFDLPHLEIFGKKRTLNQIQNNILKKEFKDPRVPFALYIGAIDGPRLLPFPPDKDLETHLDRAAIAYLKNTLIDVKGALIFPKFIKWWTDEWGPLPKAFLDPQITAPKHSRRDKMILNFLKKYRRAFKPSVATAIANPKIKIRFKHFDWSMGYK